jgi:hypothetical protein
MCILKRVLNQQDMFFLCIFLRLFFDGPPETDLSHYCGKKLHEQPDNFNMRWRFFILALISENVTLGSQGRYALYCEYSNLIFKYASLTN